MVLYHYFRSANDDRKLLDPRGPLSETIPTSSIASTNSEVNALIQSEERPGGYLSLSCTVALPQQRRLTSHGKRGI